MGTINNINGIKLIVKAPNQLIDDQSVDCDLSWTVLNLKQHLSAVYPTRPAISDQKLIYSGQLLADSALLKDVLRRYEGQKTHSLHLVCTPPRGASDQRVTSPSAPPVTPSSVSDHVTPQQEEPAAESPSTSRVPVSATPSSTDRVESSTGEGADQNGWAWVHSTQQQFMNASAQHSFMAAYPASGAAQMYDPVSLAQMQQVYAQYMTQYLCHLQQAGVSPEMLGSMQAQQHGWGAHQGHTPGTARPAGPAAVPGNPAAPVAPPNPQNNMAAAPQMMGADDDEMRLGRQRDWLDWFYVLSRLLVLFSIVYFYSSLKRFVLVSALGLLLYLYHLGYFRVQPVAEAENNNRPDGEAQPQAPAAEDARQEEDPVPAEEQAQPAGPEVPDGLRQRRRNSNQPEDGVVPPTEENAAVPPPPAVDPPSTFMLTWTFFSSFFASLIPDRPNVA